MIRNFVICNRRNAGNQYFKYSNELNAAEVRNELARMYSENTNNFIVKEVKSLRDFEAYDAETLFKRYDRPYKVLMVNRRAVKVLHWMPHTAIVEFVETGQQINVARHLIKSFIPKK